jgi:hypothetical protein
VNIGLRHQDRFVLHSNNQILVLLEGLPEGIASLENTAGDINLEGLRVRVKSFGDKIEVKSGLLGLVVMNIDLPKLVVSTKL